MKLEQDYVQELKAYNDYCELVCERNHIDRETLEDFMTFAKHVRCLANIIKEVNSKGASTNRSLQAGTMAQMARKIFNHMGYRLVTEGTMSYDEFYRLVDKLNLEMGGTGPDDEPGQYPVHYRADGMFKMFNVYINAQCAILKQIRQERGYAQK